MHMNSLSTNFHSNQNLPFISTKLTRIMPKHQTTFPITWGICFFPDAPQHTLEETNLPQDNTKRFFLSLVNVDLRRQNLRHLRAFFDFSNSSFPKIWKEYPTPQNQTNNIKMKSRDFTPISYQLSLDKDIMAVIIIIMWLTRESKVKGTSLWIVTSCHWTISWLS